MIYDRKNLISISLDRPNSDNFFYSGLKPSTEEKDFVFKSSLSKVRDMIPLSSKECSTDASDENLLQPSCFMHQKSVDSFSMQRKYDEESSLSNLNLEDINSQVCVLILNVVQ